VKNTHLNLNFHLYKNRQKHTKHYHLYLQLLVSFSISAPKKGKPNRKVGYLKMVVMEVNKEVQKSVEKTASVLSDGYKGYSKLKEVTAKHQVVVEPDKINLKSFSLGI
jgi:hypothetical protein